MPPPRKCSSECPSQSVTRDLTWYCHRCKCAIHLLCYGIKERPEDIFVIDNIVMICDECMSNPKEDASPKRKQPNSTGNMIQQVIDATNPTLTLSKAAFNTSTPPKTVNVKHSQQMQAAIESLVQKVETQTATIAKLKISVDSMNVNVSQQNTTVEKSIKINAESLSSINKVLIETPAVVESVIKHSYANVVKESIAKDSINVRPGTPKSSIKKGDMHLEKPNRTPRTNKPVTSGTSAKVIGKPISPQQSNIRSNAMSANQKAMPANQKAIWVSGLHRDTTENEMEKYVKELVGGIETDQYHIRKLVKKDRELSSYSFVSFKITCPESKFEVLLDPKKWPSNSRIREFELDRKESSGVRLIESITKSDSTMSSSGSASTDKSKNEELNMTEQMDTTTEQLSNNINDQQEIISQVTH